MHHESKPAIHMEKQFRVPINWVGQVKVSPHLNFAQGHPALAIKQSEMAATCAGLGDFQAKPSCETKLAAAGAGLELT